jgi:hypothetical protein
VRTEAAARREILRYAVVGGLLLLLVVWLDIEGRGNGNPVSLLDPGETGPSVAVVEADFPELTRLPGGTGHDGQQFYAIARDPFPIDRSAPHLDRPQYRLQRPLFPVLGWALHPQGGGVGLLLALLAVNVVGVVIGGVALGHLVHKGGGPPWAALLFAFLPGTFMSVRITTADALALALALAALATLDHRRWWLPAAFAVAAALTREPTLMVLGAVVLARRDRRSVVMVASAAAAALAWAAYVRATVPATGDQVIEFVAPLSGWFAAAGDWVDGEDRIALATCLVTLVAAIAALVRRPRGVWSIPILVQLAFLSVLGKSVIGLDSNATRTTMPVLALSLIALLQRDGQPVRALNSRSVHGRSGAVGPGRGSGGTSNR